MSQNQNGLDHGRYIKIAEYIRKKGEKIQNDAAFQGMAGGDRLIKEVELFLAGIYGRIPDQWKEFEKEFDKEQDPEYAEFLRLQKKFAG